MSDINYFFGRLTIIAIFEEKKEFVLKGLQSHTKIPRGDFKYGFFDITQVEIGEQKFIKGELIKYKKFVDEENVNEVNWTKEVVSRQDAILAKCQFFIDLENSLIVFHPVSGQITKEQFINHFKEIFESSFDGFFVEIGIQLINEALSFLSELKQFEIIEKITISLVPSNPHFGEEWKDVDKMMKDENLTNYKQTFENKNKGSIVIDKKIESGIYMADDGYGIADAKGKKNGRTKTISTKKSKNTQRAKAPKNGSIDSVLVALREKWNEIASKFKPK